MLHRIREATKFEAGWRILGGAVPVDETWIGGEPKNRHRNDPRERPRAYGTSDKQPVVSLVHYETRFGLLPGRRRRDRQVPTPGHPGGDGPQAHPPTHRLREGVGAAGAGTSPPTSTSSPLRRGVRGNVSTNLNEGYFSQLKRSLDGTHHHVSVEHLQRYLHQFDFLYTHCKDRRLRPDAPRPGQRRRAPAPLASRCLSKVDF